MVTGGLVFVPPGIRVLDVRRNSGDSLECRGRLEESHVWVWKEIALCRESFQVIF